MASTTPTVTQRVDYDRETMTDFEKKLKEKLDKVFDKVKETVRQSLEEWDTERHIKAAKQRGGKEELNDVEALYQLGYAVKVFDGSPERVLEECTYDFNKSVDTRKGDMIGERGNRPGRAPFQLNTPTGTHPKFFPHIRSHFNCYDKCGKGTDVGGYGEVGTNFWGSYKDGGSGGGPGHGRVRTLDIPRFDGNDPDWWVMSVESVFSSYCMSEEEMLEAGTMVLGGDALRLYQWENNRRPFRRWSDLKWVLLRQFRSANYHTFNSSLGGYGGRSEFRGEGSHLNEYRDKVGVNKSGNCMGSQTSSQYQEVHIYGAYGKAVNTTEYGATLSSGEFSHHSKDYNGSGSFTDYIQQDANTGQTSFASSYRCSAVRLEDLAKKNGRGVVKESCIEEESLLKEETNLSNLQGAVFEMADKEEMNVGNIIDWQIVAADAMFSEVNQEGKIKFPVDDVAHEVVTGNSVMMESRHKRVQLEEKMPKLDNEWSVLDEQRKLEGNGVQELTQIDNTKMFDVVVRKLGEEPEGLESQVNKKMEMLYGNFERILEVGIHESDIGVETKHDEDTKEVDAVWEKIENKMDLWMKNRREAVANPQNFGTVIASYWHSFIELASRKENGCNGLLISGLYTKVPWNVVVKKLVFGSGLHTEYTSSLLIMLLLIKELKPPKNVNWVDSQSSNFDPGGGTIMAVSAAVSNLYTDAFGLWSHVWGKGQNCSYSCNKSGLQISIISNTGIEVSDKNTGSNGDDVNWSTSLRIKEFFEGSKLHLIGLLSDEGVHTRIDRLLWLINGTSERDAKKIRVHALTDGRAVLEILDINYRGEESPCCQFWASFIEGPFLCLQYNLEGECVQVGMAVLFLRLTQEIYHDSIEESLVIIDSFKVKVFEFICTPFKKLNPKSNGAEIMSMGVIIILTKMLSCSPSEYVNIEESDQNSSLGAENGFSFPVYVSNLQRDESEVACITVRWLLYDFPRRQWRPGILQDKVVADVLQIGLSMLMGGMKLLRGKEVEIITPTLRTRSFLGGGVMLCTGPNSSGLSSYKRGPGPVQENRVIYAGNKSQGGLSNELCYVKIGYLGER